MPADGSRPQHQKPINLAQQLVQVWLQTLLAQVFKILQQHLAITLYGVQRIAEIVTQGLLRRLRVPALDQFAGRFLAKLPVDQFVQCIGGSADTLEAVANLLVADPTGLVAQQFMIADNGVGRRQQFLADIGQLRPSGPLVLLQGFVHELSATGSGWRRGLNISSRLASRFSKFCSLLSISFST